jgi:Flp pilus assembly protein TadD
VTPKFAEAEDAYRNAVAMDPFDGIARARLGSVLHDVERFADAAAAYERSLATYTCPFSHLMLGKCHARLGNAALARAHLARAARMDPGFAHAAMGALPGRP